jgi:hypothetical protein
MAYQTVGPTLGINFTQVDTTPQFPLGLIVQARDPDLGVGEFIYLKGVASTAVGSVVLYDQDAYTTSLLAANDIGPVAFAMAATIANTYGWYQITGKCVAKVATSYADDALVYATATAGTVDDAVTAGDRVKRARSCSAIDTPSTGLAYIRAERPWMDDATAA